jgi:hypothetical protein
METGLMITLASLIFALMVQIVIIAVWGGKITQKVEGIKQDIVRLGISQLNNNTTERLYIAEGEIRAQGDRLTQVEQNGD